MLDRRRPRSAVVAACAGACGLAVAAGCTLAAATAGTAGAQERPDFQLPFECGQEWRLDTWGHAPALDMVREPDQHGTEGALLLAPADGTVNRSFRHDNAGEVIQIDHGGGWFTTYLHLQSRSVAVGDEVRQGDEIGRVGRSGPTANNHPHLHFELAVDEDGDGQATWGFAGAERVRPWLDGVEYGQSNGDTWRNVASGNCGEPEPPPTTATTEPPATTSTTAATTTTTSTTTTTAPTTTSSSTTTTAAPVPTTVPPAGGDGDGGDGGLPVTGSNTVFAAIAGTLLVATGASILYARRRLAAEIEI
ncbi:MAG TPA: M23 family metallopeptidase [Acidimicrobiales bacterium]